METESTKGKSLYIDDQGFEWRLGPTINLGGTQTWRCPLKSCGGYGHSRIGTTNLNIAKDHNHEPNLAKKEVREVVTIVKKRYFLGKGKGCAIKDSS